jgi:hypothetical protein
LYRVCFASFAEINRRGVTVAREKQEDHGTGKAFDWTFVNVQLTEEECQAARLDYQEEGTLWDTLITVLKDGYKVTLSYEADSDSYCAALSGTNCGKPNEKQTLTAWGENETVALMYLFYKHVTKLEFVWAKPGAKTRRLG